MNTIPGQQPQKIYLSKIVKEYPLPRLEVVGVLLISVVLMAFVDISAIISLPYSLVLDTGFL